MQHLDALLLGRNGFKLGAVYEAFVRSGRAEVSHWDIAAVLDAGPQHGINGGTPLPPPMS